MIATTINSSTSSDIKYKHCCQCKTEKPATNQFFTKNKKSKDGLQKRCKDCQKICQQRSYYSDVEKSRERARLNNAKRRSNPEYREREKLEKRVRYATDPEYNERIKKIQAKARAKRRLNRPKKVPKMTIAHTRKDPLDAIVIRSLKNHRNHGCIFSVSKEDIVALFQQIKHCTLCGVEMDRNYTKRARGIVTKTIQTLDRMNNEKTITAQNIQILCHQCNTKKGKKGMKEFITYCKMIADRFPMTKIKNNNLCYNTILTG